jgi:hypothetical protein
MILPYFVLLAIIITIEHIIFALVLKWPELARRTMGIATVLGLAFPLALRGYISIATWFFFVFAFGLCGAIVAFVYTLEASIVRLKMAAKVKEMEREIARIDHADACPFG